MGEDIDAIQEMLSIKRRRQHELEKKAAIYGIDAPPQVVLEIESLRIEIDQLEKQLESTKEWQEFTPLPLTSSKGVNFKKRGFFIVIITLLVFLIFTVFYGISIMKGGEGAAATTLDHVIEEVNTSSSVSMSNTTTIELPTDVPTLEPRVIIEKSTGIGASEKYTIKLDRDEVVVGDAFEVNGNNNSERGCVVFLIVGPIEYDLYLISGGWRKYDSITNQTQVEDLFDEGIQRLIKNNAFCTPEATLRLRFP